MKIDLSGEWTYKAQGGVEGKVKIPAAYDGIGELTFERSFEIDSHDFDKYQFHIVVLGANYSCAIWINNDFVVNHLGGYTSFISPIPNNVLQVGRENVIRVVTDNRLDPVKTLPTRQGVRGLKNYGGIFRHIYILATPKVYIADVAATSEVSPDFSSARIRTRVSLEENVHPESARRRWQVAAEVYERISGALVAASQPATVVSDGNHLNPVTLECLIRQPHLWSPSTPTIYSLRTFLIDGGSKAIVDEYRLNIGVRKIEIVGGTIVLNGARVMLNGVVWYEDHADYGNALPHAQMEKDVILIKNLGANAIRFAQRPPHPFMLNLCDRYGLLALVELPAHDVPALVLGNEHFIELAETRMREIIVRDRNHPSVFAWGVGDEFESSDTLARRFVESVARTARSLDSRPLYYGTRALGEDACSDVVDMTALTVTIRDPKQFRTLLEEWKNTHPQRPLLIGRLGVEVQPDNKNGYTDPLSVQAQARFYYQHLHVVRESDAAGVFIWSFNDWRGDRPALTVNSGNPWLRTFGLVSTTREKRLAYEAVRRSFAGEKPLALPPGKNVASSPIEFVVAGLVLLIGTAYLYNAKRRFRESLNRSILNSYNFFSDIRDQRIVTFTHSSVVGIAVAGAFTTVVASILHRYRTNVVLDDVLSYLLVADEVKERLIALIMQPTVLLLLGTAALFLLLMCGSLLVWVVAQLFRVRVYPFHTFAVTMWSITPMLILIPVSMLVYRLLENPLYLLPTIGLCMVLAVWVFLRFLKALTIVTDASPLKVYTFGTLAVMAMIVGGYVYFDQTQGASVYVSVLYHDLLGKIR
ncbi:MAG: hypothetical protein C4326_10675 [Ignavibacteria bacterium]